MSIERESMAYDAVMVGDAASFLNVAKIKSGHTAMTSGMPAAVNTI